MDLQNSVPLVVYDNACYLCIKFAKAVNFFARGKIRLVGHYTEFGEKLRNEILDSTAIDMFWFIDGKTAYGGRAALIPLIAEIVKSKKNTSINYAVEDSCDTECKTPKAVFVRSASLFSNSKKIEIN